MTHNWTVSEPYSPSDWTDRHSGWPSPGRRPLDFTRSPPAPPQSTCLLSAVCGLRPATCGLRFAVSSLQFSNFDETRKETTKSLTVARVARLRLTTKVSPGLSFSHQSTCPCSRNPFINTYLTLPTLGAYPTLPYPINTRPELQI